MTSFICAIVIRPPPPAAAAIFLKRQAGWHVVHPGLEAPGRKRAEEQVGSRPICATAGSVSVTTQDEYGLCVAGENPPWKSGRAERSREGRKN